MRRFTSLIAREFRRLNFFKTPKFYKFSTSLKMEDAAELDEKFEQGPTVQALTTKVTIF